MEVTRAEVVDMSVAWAADTWVARAAEDIRWEEDSQLAADTRPEE